MSAFALGIPAPAAGPGQAGPAGARGAAAAGEGGRGGRDGFARALAEAEAGGDAGAPGAAGEPTAEPAPLEASSPEAAPAVEAGGWPPPGLASLALAAAPVAITAVAGPLAGALAQAALGGGAPDTAAKPNGPPVDPAAEAPTLAGLAAVTASALKAGAQGLAAQAQAAQLQAAQAALADAGAASALAAADAGGEGAGPSFQGLLQAPTPAAAAPTPPPALQLPVPLASGRFAEDIGARVGWLAGQQIGHAEIRVNPDGLGPIEIRLRLDGDRVTADFLSPHAEVRQALEQGLPRLREMLAGQGFTLANADVGQQASGQSPDAPAFRFGGGDGEDGETGEGGPAPMPVMAAMRGLVDAWA